MRTNHLIERSVLIRRAIRLEWVTAIWMTIEAIVAVGSGIRAGSLSLIAFGADSFIELASAGVLLWRLRIELQLGGRFSEEIERRASKIAGALLLTLGIYVVASAAYALWRHTGQEFSAMGLALTILAIPIMWFLAKAKLRLADQIKSRALRADAVESITCGYLSAVVMVSLMVQFLMPQWWWADSVTAFAIVWFLIKEGREAWHGETCCDD